MTLLLTTQYHPLNTHALTHSRRAYTAVRPKKLRLCLEAEECNTPKKRIPLKGGCPEKHPLRQRAGGVSSFVPVTVTGGRRCRVTTTSACCRTTWLSAAFSALCVRTPRALRALH